MPKRKVTDAKGTAADPAAASAAAAAARAEVFDALHQEMAIADYAVGHAGQKVRRVPRSQRIERAEKRKALEEADMVEMGIEADDDDKEGDDSKKKRKRLRGSKVALQDVVVKSMPLSNNRATIKDASSSKRVTFEAAKDGADEAFDEDKNDSDRYEMLHDAATLGIELDPDEDFEREDENDNDNDDEDEDYEDEDEDEEDGTGEDEIESDGKSGDDENDKISQRKSNSTLQSKVVVSSGLVKPKNKPKGRRLMHRLRDFASERLSQKHGEAISAHVRGMSETAVQKLREVAKAAPGAPQVYSSLGMVFESMLTQVEEEERDINKEGGDETGEMSRLNILLRRLELVQKTYASYHVAALLCKRDFVLWERSGDVAMKTSQIYSELIDHMANYPVSDWDAIDSTTLIEDTKARTGFDLCAGPEKWNAERKTWFDHAFSSYQSSDSLRPSGVELPCKLASMHMKLGNYIEALTILTDLRSRASEQSAGDENETDRELRRSPIEGSYPFWLLYADLMIRIGYDCGIWNDGTSKIGKYIYKRHTEKYMYKQWLKKHANNFDWKERRLQALCLALEAAAGTASCKELVIWMKKRAEKYIDVGEDNGKEANENDSTKEDESPEDDGSARRDEFTKNKESRPSELTYEEERVKLINRNKLELQKFDGMTKEMNLVEGSHIFKNRIAARKALINKQRAAIKELAMSKYKKEPQHSHTHQETIECQQPDSPKNESSPKPLPIQGSFATVYDIAALLLKQCIELKLYDGGLLAAQSVLNYFKERASRHERKNIELQRRSEMLQNKGQELVQAGLKYDQINLESDDSDEEGLETYISDDEDLDQPETLQSLKGGRLPVDIMAMYNICLLGTGGQDYVALCRLEQVICSRELDSFGKDSVNQDPDISGNHQRMAFSNNFSAPINKTSLLASLADLVTDKAYDRARSNHLLRIFRKHLKEIDNNEGKKQGLDDALASPKESDRADTLKILLASLKLMVQCAATDLATLNDPGKEKLPAIEQSVAASIFALMMMLRFQHILWTPRHSDWSLPQPSMDMMSLVSGSASILVKAASLSNDKRLRNSIQVGYMKARHLISTICHADSTPWKYSAQNSVGSWQTFPLPSKWQNGFHEKISLRTYNLCVSCCVSSFSGWEPNEFNLDLLRNCDVNFFGISLDGPFAGGVLPNYVASAIAEQWEHIRAILPDLEVLPFESHLAERKKMSWYKKVLANSDSKKISKYAEEDGIKALLSFSTLCLNAAEEVEGDERDEYVKQSMSILLPLTQFSIDKQVWQSTLGTSVINSKNETKVGYYVDENCTWLGPTKSKEGKMHYTSKTPKLPQPSKFERAPRREFQQTNVVTVPTSVLMEEWKKDDVNMVSKGKAASEDAKLAMKKVDDSMKNLRKSRTLNSLEKASIDVSVSLLSLATYEECNNPFVCLQQAAMFAAMGSKRGNNDEPFKKFLPLKENCKPLEALNILGRADCLRAIYFLQEAQYLCTWVASVCRMHRDRLEIDLPWNSCWRVIGIITYVVSATIDETGEALSQDDTNAGALRKWDDTAKEEFLRGKSDACVLVKEDQGTAPIIANEPPAERETLEAVEDTPGKEEAILGDQGVINEMDPQSLVEQGTINEQNGQLPLSVPQGAIYQESCQLPSLVQQGLINQANGFIYQESHQLPLPVQQGAINQTNQQFAYQHQFHDATTEQYLFQKAFDESVVEGEANENGDDYDPYAGVEAVGI